MLPRLVQPGVADAGTGAGAGLARAAESRYVAHGAASCPSPLYGMMQRVPSDTLPERAYGAAEAERRFSVGDDGRRVWLEVRRRFDDPRLLALS